MSRDCPICGPKRKRYGRVCGPCVNSPQILPKQCLLQIVQGLLPSLAYFEGDFQDSLQCFLAFDGDMGILETMTPQEIEQANRHVQCPEIVDRLATAAMQTWTIARTIDRLLWVFRLFNFSQTPQTFCSPFWGRVLARQALDAVYVKVGLKEMESRTYRQESQSYQRGIYVIRRYYQVSSRVRESALPAFLVE